MAKRTATKSFGTSKREAHDASRFYSRPLYAPEGWTVEPKYAPAGAETAQSGRLRRALVYMHGLAAELTVRSGAKPRAPDWPRRDPD